MVFVRRDRPPVVRFVALRVGLFFLAAGLWFAGVSVGNTTVTWIAIGVATVAILLGLVLRRIESREAAPEDEDEWDGEELEETP